MGPAGPSLALSAGGGGPSSTGDQSAGTHLAYSFNNSFQAGGSGKAEQVNKADATSTDSSGGGGTNWLLIGGVVAGTLLIGGIVFYVAKRSK